MSDDDWAALVKKATQRGYTVSEYIRRVTNAHAPSTSTWAAVKGEHHGDSVTLVGQPSEPQQVVTIPPQAIDPDRPVADRFNTRPFTPVPKSRK